jgi:hypothetical protein
MCDGPKSLCEAGVWNDSFWRFCPESGLSGHDNKADITTSAGFAIKPAFHQPIFVFQNLPYIQKGQKAENVDTVSGCSRAARPKKGLTAHFCRTLNLVAI